MDERLEKALQTSNFLASLNLLRKTAFEEFKQNLVFYHNGCSFLADLSFLTQIQSLKQSEFTAIILDINNIPCYIDDLESFYQNCLSTYKIAVEEYHTKYQNIKKQRNIRNLIDL